MSGWVVLAIVLFGVAVVLACVSFTVNLAKRGSALAGDRGPRTQRLSLALLVIFVALGAVALVLQATGH